MPWSIRTAGSWQWMFTPASLQGRDGARPLLRASCRCWPFVHLAYTDAAHAGTPPSRVIPVSLAIGHNPKDEVSVAVPPPPRVAERSFAWSGCNRRPARYFEASLAAAKAFLTPPPCSAAGTVRTVRRMSSAASFADGCRLHPPCRAGKPSSPPGTCEGTAQAARHVPNGAVRRLRTANGLKAEGAPVAHHRGAVAPVPRPLDARLR